MSKYRRRPLIIDAFRWTGGPDQQEDPEWIVEAIKNGDAGSDKDGESFWLKTPLGIHRAFTGWYIIRRTTGEIDSCEPTIFETRYEKCEHDPRSEFIPSPAKVEMADKIVREITRVGDYLGLWDDHEFDELREAIADFEGKRS